MKIIFFWVLLVIFGFNNCYASKIHVMGDSHCDEFGHISNTCLHWMGPVTMHRVGRDSLSVLNLKSFDVSDGDTAIFCFGEIDARCHIQKQVEKHNRSLEEVIATLTEKYIETIKKNRDLFNNLTCVVYCVTPPTDIYFDSSFLYFGSLAQRVRLKIIKCVTL